MARAKDVTAAIRSSLAVGIAVGISGISFGALSVTAGLDIWQTCVLSLVMFSGGSQFALIGIIGTAGTGAAAAAISSAALLGLRNTLYAIRMAPVVGGRTIRTLLAGHWTIDESTAVATAQPTAESQRAGFWWTGATIYVLWNLSTLGGALLGDIIGDVSAYGLDAAAAAAFVGLLWPRLKTLQPVAVAVGAAVIAVALIPVVPAGVPVLAAALVAVVVGYFDWFGAKEEKQ